MEIETGFQKWREQVIHQNLESMRSILCLVESLVGKDTVPRCGSAHIYTGDFWLRINSGVCSWKMTWRSWKFWHKFFICVYASIILWAVPVLLLPVIHVLSLLLKPFHDHVLDTSSIDASRRSEYSIIVVIFQVRH